MKTLDPQHPALFSVWLAAISLFSAMGFLAARFDAYLLGSAVFGIIAWTSMKTPLSKKRFLRGVAISIVAGVVCRLYFFEPEGISLRGFVFVFVPAALLIGAALFSIFRFESQEDRV